MYPGMVQVVPDVTVQVSQLARELGRPRSAVLVYDSSTNDYYTSDLNADFARTFRDSLRGQPQPYTPSEGTDSQFAFTAVEVCSPPETPVVLYAGRQVVLSAFIGQLKAYNGCAGKRITIVTGGDGDGLPKSSTTNRTGEGQVSVVYSDVADLGKLTPQFRDGYATDLKRVDPAEEGLDDTWLTTAYNAMSAAVTAIHQAYTGTAPRLPDKDAVLPWVDRLNEALQVTGATGLFSLDNHGRLLNFTVPVFADINGQRRPFTPLIASELSTR
jgi:hypothetical protein